MLAKMFLAGAQNIESKKEFINELNVFPVPDGDTGTNMSLTIMSAAKEVTALTDYNMKDLAKAISSGSLRGARGNSGVILSQLLRGFTKSIREEKEIDAAGLAAACARARDTAYKAVMKPKEGTILTVASGIAEKAAEMALETDDLEVFIPEVIKHAEEVLAKTPDLLPVLKEAGVVDSGGQGLLEVIRGAYDAFLGKEIDYSAITPGSGAGVGKMAAPQEAADIKFGYCTEFIILTEKEFMEKDEKELKSYLSSIGDSIVCVADEDVVKIQLPPVTYTEPLILSGRSFNLTGSRSGSQRTCFTAGIQMRAQKGNQNWISIFDGIDFISVATRTSTLAVIVEIVFFFFLFFFYSTVEFQTLLPCATRSSLIAWFRSSM